MKDFINTNSAPERPRIDSRYDESRREGVRLAAETEKCQGNVRRFADVIFERLTTKESATRLSGDYQIRMILTRGIAFNDALTQYRYICASPSSATASVIS
jgi:hypothetical protein